VINDTEAITIREIFRLYNDGNGYDKIITELNAQGYRTKKDKPFGKNSLHEIIANEKYSGVYIFNRSSSKDFEGTRNNHESKDDDDVIRIDGGVPTIIAKEEFAKAKHRMIANKTGAGRYKAKELYLLSGLIFCGECGHRMQGNMRFGGRNKLKYVSYKWGGRENCKSCDNKEIRREYIESFVLSEMERLIFNDKAIPQLVKKLQSYQSERSNDNEKEVKEINARLHEVNIQLENIINAVASGYTKSAFKDKISELEKLKNELELRLKEIELTNSSLSVNESMLRKMIAMFQQYVKEQNIPECKKFIDSFLQKVVIYKDKVEVVFKIASTSFEGQNDCLIFKTEEKIQTLFSRFKVA
jgi:site-specific DNA recombinase